MDNKKTIIVETCQNHKGDLKILEEMIWEAADAGADYIKIQSMQAEDLTKRERFEKGIIESNIVKAIKRPYKEEYERLKPMDLNEDAHLWFIEKCKEAKIKPLTTIFSFSRLKFLSSLDWDSIKIASYDCASYPLLEELKNNFKHLFISTGATYDKEIKKAAEILKGHSFSFLHCVTIYPTPLNEVHLNRINWLKQFTNSVGFSDHSLVERDGIKASIAALYFGADIIERHYTVLPGDQIKDGPVSIDKKQLKEIVDFSRLPKEDQKNYIKDNVKEFETMLGDETRELSENELLNRDYYKGRFAAKKEDGTLRYNWEN